MVGLQTRPAVLIYERMGGKQSCGSGGFDDADFVFGEAVEFIDQAVNFLVGGLNLLLNEFFFSCSVRARYRDNNFLTKSRRML